MAKLKGNVGPGSLEDPKKNKGPVVNNVVTLVIVFTVGVGEWFKSLLDCLKRFKRFF